MTGDPRALLRAMFDAAVAAVQPANCVPAHLPPRPSGRTVVVGAGKAAAAMAQTVEAHWRGKLSGLVVTRYGHAVPCRDIEVVEAGHPMPDAQGLDAAARIVRLVSGLTADDLVLCLISGGGSALLAQPAPGVPFEDKQALTRALLRCGATIHEINCVRKHLSAIKGGRLALTAAPARVVTLAISDVPGDDPATIASGPTVPDATTLAQARAVLAKYAIEPSPAIAKHLDDPANETPKTLDNAETRIVATARGALNAAAEIARRAGFDIRVLGDDLEGEARDVGAEQGRLARGVEGAAAIISGGETTVTVDTEGGRGGRNCEYLLSLAVALDGAPGIHALACDTDGIDGTEPNAGAILAPDSLARARALGLYPSALLRAHDSYRFFDALGDLIVTGPTLTNVNDFRVILIGT